MRPSREAGSKIAVFPTAGQTLLVSVFGLRDSALLAATLTAVLCVPVFQTVVRLGQIALTAAGLEPAPIFPTGIGAPALALATLYAASGLLHTWLRVLLVDGTRIRWYESLLPRPGLLSAAALLVFAGWFPAAAMRDVEFLRPPGSRT